MRYAALFCVFVVIAMSAQSCTMEEKITIKKKVIIEEEEVIEEITRVDSAHGYGYPFTFQRAKSLRRAKMFIPASYVYIHLYQEQRDSTLREALRMSEEMMKYDSTRYPSYYFQQAIGTEMLMDHAINPPGGKMNQVEMKKRYEWTSDILNALGASGVR